MLDPLGLDHDAVDVYLDDLSNFVKAPLHASLVRHPGVFEAKGHRHVALCAEWSDEVGREHRVSHPVVKSTTYSMHGKGYNTLGQALFRLV